MYIGATSGKGKREGEKGCEETIVMVKQVRLEKDVMGGAERGVTEGICSKLTPVEESFDTHTHILFGYIRTVLRGTAALLDRE